MTPDAPATIAPTPDVSLRQLESLVSRRTGLVRRVDDVLAAPDDARLIRSSAVCADTRPLIGVDSDELGGGGGGWGERRGAARAAAIGELAERYSACCVPVSPVVVGVATDVAGAIDPERFALFAHSQHATPSFRFEPFSRTTPVRWVRGFSLPDGREAWLPAQLVYLPLALARGETRIGYATSNGLACGTSLEAAVLAAFLEVVERDAFMLTWLNRLSLPLLDWRGNSEIRAFEDRYLARSGGTHVAVDLTVFLEVPTALGVIHGDGAREPALAIGAASAPTITAAVKKALAEAYAVRAWARRLLSEPPKPRAADFSDIVSFEDHVDLYARDRSATEFLTASLETRPVADVAPLEGSTPCEWIRALANRLAAEGASAYAVDVTSPDVREAGLSVAKVLAPELCPLDVRYDARFLGSRRIYQAAWQRGLRDRPLAWNDLNPAPHPFP